MVVLPRPLERKLWELSGWKDLRIATETALDLAWFASRSLSLAQEAAFEGGEWKKLESLPGWQNLSEVILKAESDINVVKDQLINRDAPTPTHAGHLADTNHELAVDLAKSVKDVMDEDWREYQESLNNYWANFEESDQWGEWGPPNCDWEQLWAFEPIKLAVLQKEILGEALWALKRRPQKGKAKKAGRKSLPWDERESVLVGVELWDHYANKNEQARYRDFINTYKHKSHLASFLKSEEEMETQVGSHRTWEKRLLKDYRRKLHNLDLDAFCDQKAPGMPPSELEPLIQRIEHRLRQRAASRDVN